MASISNSLEISAVHKLEEVGARLTSSRKIILSILESSKHPVTVTQISNKAPGLVQSSLYRNLSVLENAELVRRIVNENGFAFFELDEQLLGHHHHLRCTNCGLVSDIELPQSAEDILEKTAIAVSKKNKFSNIEHHLDFSGLCSNCKGK